MTTKLFVNLPVKNLPRSKAFFTDLGFTFFGSAEDMTSMIISKHTQVMLLAESTFAAYATNDVADPARSTQVILVLGVENRTRVDELVDKALAAGATPAASTAKYPDDIHHRGFIDLDGHHWEALYLDEPTN
jgi:uncharacterized protein